MQKRLLQKWGHYLLAIVLSGIWCQAGAQSQIKGRVTDAQSSEGMPGVNVVVKGTSSGTTTDANGNYALAIQDRSSTLIFSFIGYKTLEVETGDQTILDVRLEVDVVSLQEVVVVGYGTQQKAHLTGAVASTNMENFAKVPTGDAINALQGQVAGVTVATPTGAPGATPVVQIRGYSTINGASPLFVIDGIPSDPSYLNPAEIESMTVLKDASAATIYGSRGANGVILITTKRGKSGKPQITVNSFVSVNNASVNGVEQANKVQRNTILRNAYTNAGIAPPVWATDDTKYDDSKWVDTYFKQGLEQKHDISIAGGTDKMVYSYSAGYYGNTGTIINTGFNRYNSRLNLEFKDLLKDRLKISTGMSFVRKDLKNYSDVTGSGNAGFSPLMYLYTALPHKSIYDPNSPNGYAGQLTDLGVLGAGNPVGEQSLPKNTSQDDYLQLNLGADLKIIEGLMYQFRVGANIENTYNDSYYPQYDFGPGATVETPRAWETRGRTNSVIFNNLLTFTKEFDNHNIKILAGQSSEKNEFRSAGGSNLALASNDVRALSAGLGTQGSFGTIVENRLLSFFGRVSYSFADRYFLEASLRRDGSSRFGPENRYGTFYGISGGWSIHRESFFSSNMINELKPRFSYGVVGNQQIDDFLFQSVVATGGSQLSYPFGLGSPSQSIFPGATSLGIGVPGIKWEQNAMSNAGLDLGLFEGKLGITFDYFRSKTEGMLVPRSVTGSSGVSIAPTTNAGNFENKGLEISITYKKQTGAFQYNITANAGTSRNKVTQLGYTGQQFIDGYVEFNNYATTRTAVGTPVGEFYLKEVTGIFKTQAEVDAYKDKDGNPLQPNAKPGDFKFADINNDGVIDDQDKKSFGTGLPKATFGLNFNATWKNFDVVVMLNGTVGNKMYNAFKMDLYRLNASPDLLNSWRADNASSSIPRLIYTDPNNNYTTSSNYFLEDASYLRLRNFQIGYNFPTSVLERLGVSKFRVYAGGYNLLTITGYSGFDPGLSNYGKFARGVDRGYYPVNRTYVMGLTIGL